MKTTPPRRRVLAVAGLTAAALTLTACASGGGSGTASSGSASSGSGGDSGGSKNYRITFVPKNLGNPYFDASDKAGQATIEKFGGTYKEVGPAAGSSDPQNTYIETLTRTRVGAIVISAADASGVCDPLKAAKAAGVKVIAFDADTATPDCRDVFVAPASTEAVGKKQIDLVAEALGAGGGDVAILSAAANADNQNAWIKVMKDYAPSKKIKIVDTVYGNDVDQTSTDKTEGLLQKYPDLKAIIAPTTVGIAAAAKYISKSDKKGKIFVTGLGLPSQMKPYVKDGTVKKFALWNPQDLGILASWAAKAAIDGKITGKKGDTFTAEGLSNKETSFTVQDDGVVYVGDPFVFDESNIDKFAAIY